MESLYYGHRKDDQSIFVRFERAAKQISYIPNHGCLFLCVRAYDSKFSFAILVPSSHSPIIAACFL